MISSVNSWLQINTPKFVDMEVESTDSMESPQENFKKEHSPVFSFENIGYSSQESVKKTANLHPYFEVCFQAEYYEILTVGKSLNNNQQVQKLPISIERKVFTASTLCSGTVGHCKGPFLQSRSPCYDAHEVAASDDNPVIMTISKTYAKNASGEFVAQTNWVKCPTCYHRDELIKERVEQSKISVEESQNSRQSTPFIFQYGNNRKLFEKLATETEHRDYQYRSDIFSFWRH